MVQSFCIDKKRIVICCIDSEDEKSIKYRLSGLRTFNRQKRQLSDWNALFCLVSAGISC